MLVECARCGAPLEVKGSERTCRCSYCRSMNRLEALRTIAEATPPGWRAPDVWRPPPGFEVQGELKRAGTVVAGLSLVTLLMIFGSLAGSCLVCVAFVLLMWALDPEARDRPIIEGPGFTQPWPDGPPPRR